MQDGSCCAPRQHSTNSHATSYMQRQATFSSERRSSGRLRDLSKKYKVSTDATTEIKIERRNARLDFLENDNFVPERNKRDEEDQEFVLDDDAGLHASVYAMFSQCVFSLHSQEKEKKDRKENKIQKILCKLQCGVRRGIL